MSLFKTAALGLAASGLALTAIPASAAEFSLPGFRAAPATEIAHQYRDQYRDQYGRQYDRYERRQDRYERKQERQDRRYDRRTYSQAAYAEPVYQGTQTWRGQDGRYYCRKKNGTTGLIVGAAAGALLGREIDKYGSRTTGTLLGAAAGALLGKTVTSGTTCR